MSLPKAGVREGVDLVVFVPRRPDGSIQVRFARMAYEDCWDLMVTATS